VQAAVRHSRNASPKGWADGSDGQGDRLTGGCGHTLQYE
jgi:hypothetical protein